MQESNTAVSETFKDMNIISNKLLFNEEIRWNASINIDELLSI